MNDIPESRFKRHFDECFRAWYKPLHRYAFTIVKDNELASEAVQGVFIRWWEGKTEPGDRESSRKYLFTAVYRNSLNLLRNEKTKARYLANYVGDKVDKEDFRNSLELKQLDRQIQLAIEELPPQCRLIFVKSRFEDKTYSEIAKELNLSIKTIQAQMGKALKVLRAKVQDYVT